MSDFALGAILGIVSIVATLALTAVWLALKNGSLKADLANMTHERDGYHEAWESAKRLGSAVAAGRVAAGLVDGPHLDRLLAEVRAKRRATPAKGDSPPGAAALGAGGPAVPDPGLGEAHGRRVS